jgi:hypothetical protein
MFHYHSDSQKVILRPTEDLESFSGSSWSQNYLENKNYPFHRIDIWADDVKARVDEIDCTLALVKATPNHHCYNFYHSALEFFKFHLRISLMKNKNKFRELSIFSILCKVFTSLNVKILPRRTLAHMFQEPYIRSFQTKSNRMSSTRE